jgi:hypothetical protein
LAIINAMEIGLMPFRDGGYRVFDRGNQDVTQTVLMNIQDKLGELRRAVVRLGDA